MGNFKRSPIKVVGVPGEKKEIGPGENNRKSGQNFPNLVKDKNLQINQWQNWLVCSNYTQQCKQKNLQIQE